jgi:hypothetical protein
MKRFPTLFLFINGFYRDPQITKKAESILHSTQLQDWTNVPQYRKAGGRADYSAIEPAVGQTMIGKD